ncbi:N-acetyltransferase [Notoacmeibacter ruber]|uniref:N-acetyltransferase n=1 Tax=Notoacmeibacter ruber TaxID=2670375 RepID=A0A3L7JGB3_9HYPH|nr:N-acetyltransferase [Notoacmeibacter ruber]
MPRPRPSPERLTGSLVELTGFQPAKDAAALWSAFGERRFNDLIRYFPNKDFNSEAQFRRWLEAAQGDWHTMVFRRLADHSAIGMASYMRIDEKNGVCETGAVAHAPAAQGTPEVTEAHFLMARHVFDDLGYRRFEWKLDNRNEASHRAAQRLGFTFEGVFRQHMVSRGRNRDTAWYAMIDTEWPVIRRAFEIWLEPSNFDAEGQQRKRLADIRADLLSTP